MSKHLFLFINYPHQLSLTQGRVDYQAVSPHVQGGDRGGSRFKMEF